MRTGVFVFLILLMSAKAFGQEKWTLQQCVDYAKQSQMTLYPSLTGSMGSSYQHGLTTNPTTNILESSSYISGNMNLQASYTIFNWNARKNTIAANNLALKADETG